ncbi:hypothetical protein FEM48_Zijuj05G0181500 [Ziziphus jujuba var. spinosa]|uniref:Probably inactive leucine-rich repeat receptor-like protein kinase At5g48380 n=1 Tax=Ziziphus jujuba var. spinosa TaxID=714518 RepID=A0A978VGC4_ZIZJJ|nr:hypothetical protein FEM48_Zijuj05G0181500 [Ziziphus jujuba var. spinosa]
MNSHTKMSLNATSFILIHLVVWSYLGIFSVIHGTLSDILCLRSVKESIEDPLNSLTSSWNFDNQTEGFLCKFSEVDCWHFDESKDKFLNSLQLNLGLRATHTMHDYVGVLWNPAITMKKNWMISANLDFSWLQAIQLVMQIISLSMVGNKKRNKADQWNHLKTLKGKEYTRLEKLVNKISLTELVKATDDFNVANVIGRGKMGTMYKATLPNEGDNRILDWPSRVKIAIGIAKGLAWLHHKCIFRVVHHNISTKSILLDRYSQPNISNFENSIISNHGGAMFLYPNDNDSGFNGEIMQFLRIASDCVQPFPYQRPMMLEVYKRISSFGERYGIQSDPRVLMQPNEKRLMTVHWLLRRFMKTSSKGRNSLDVIHGTLHDILCLRSIKESIEDPLDSLTSSWNFDHQTEGLNHNQMVGNLPMELGLLSRLTRFDVAHNLLTGQVPDFITAKAWKIGYNKISFPELIKATDNFSVDDVIGRGTIGTMYKATLPKWLVSCNSDIKVLDWPSEGQNCHWNNKRISMAPSQVHVSSSPL